MKRSVLSVALLFTLSFSFGQKPEVDSKKIIERGIELHDKGNYDEAIAEFKKVNKNDTNFVLVCLELANTYIANKQDSLAILVCDRASVLPSSFAPNILLYKANALDNLKKTDEAIKLYQEGMKKYPLNNSFFYELGVLKLRQEKYKEANDLFIQSIKCNPYHEASHHQMAMLALKQGKLIPAMLAWQYYLMLDNSSERAMSIINELEKIAQNEYEFKDGVVKVEGLSEEDDFSEIEALVRSKVALGNKYKSKIALNYNVNKQMQLVFEKLTYVKSDKGFYMQFYAPLFEAMNKKGLFEPFVYNILGGLKSDDIKSWLKKNKDDSQKFTSWVLDYLGTNVSTFETTLNGKTVNARHWYTNGKILAVGNQNGQGGYIGYWNFYYNNGILRSEGAFNDKNKREGIWKFYYPSGIIKDIETYKDGSIDGNVEQYYTNGNIETRKNYTNDLLDGLQSVYYATGGKQTTYEYKAGKQEGKEAAYYSNGAQKYELVMTNGKYEGNFIQSYNNGHIMEKSFFKEGLRIGKYESYYNFPEKTLKSEANYEKGIPTGEYKEYYRNGKLSETGLYNKSGMKDGTWKNFYEDGTISMEQTFSDGKEHGTTKYYEESGKLIEEYTYKNNVLQEYKAYDLKGGIVYQNKKDGKNNYDATLYYPNGNKKREGKVLGGKFTGAWKNYNENGMLTSVDTYTDGARDGKSVSYFDNGKVRSETDYAAGETNGYYREYFKNGKLRMEGAYIKDKQIDVWTTYLVNGNLKSVNFYIDGDLDGWQEYYAVNGKLDYEEFYELGYVEKRVFYDTVGNIIQEFVFPGGSGMLARNFPNGKLSSKYEYKNNKVNGPVVAYFPDGQLMTSKTFVNGEVNGEMKTYFANGKEQWSRTYIDGDQHGKETRYADDGSLEREANYEYGALQGKYTIYYPNKKPEREYQYKDNSLNGVSRIYSETGELVMERTYKDGLLVAYTYMDKTGALVPLIEVKNETGDIKTYFKNGGKALEYTLKNGCIEGHRIMYHPNGKVQEDETYVGDELNGMRKYYYASGSPKTEVNLISDELDGKCMNYYENGKVKSEEYYVCGSLHGTCKYYDATGKLLRTMVYYNDEILDEK